MNPQFDYIFELFTLLISLAVAEMLMGFSRILKLRARRKAGVDPTAISVRVGWLVPLLGLLVLIDLATFWSIIWSMRGVLDMRIATIFAVLVLIGGYYLIATLVFPDEPELWPDFDAYFWQQKRLVVGGILLINLASTLASIMLGAQGAEQVAAAQKAAVEHPAFAISSMVMLLNFPAFLWLAFSKRRIVCIVLMGFIIFTQLFHAYSTWGLDGIM